MDNCSAYTQVFGVQEFIKAKFETVKSLHYRQIQYDCQYMCWNTNTDMFGQDFGVDEYILCLYLSFYVGENHCDQDMELISNVACIFCKSHMHSGENTQCRFHRDGGIFKK